MTRKQIEQKAKEIMTTKEKTQAYDEALKKAKDYYEKGYMMINAALVNIFPELKESEDERMRKEAISIIKQYNIICERECDKCYTADRVIAWLEKQGEQSDYNPYKATVEAIAAMVEKYAPFDSNLQDFYNNVKIKCQDAIEYDITWIKKQGEEKPADKVEPKFKIGYWVVNNRTSKIYKIDSIDAKDANYITYSCVPSIYTNEDLPCFSESMIHLWTIQDAKDGDVLADNYGIYIFDRFDEYDERCYFCKGAYQYSQKVYENEQMLCSVEVHPATQEQRDILVQKIKEAGYEWDSEKKELKKIKQ